MPLDSEKESSSPSLFETEKRTIARATALLQNEQLDPQELRAAFAGLLKEYTTLHRHTDRLIRISDRQQKTLVFSENKLRDTLERLQQQEAKLLSDQQVIEEILVKMRAEISFDDGHLRHVQRFMDNTGGDLLFSMRRPDGVRHILLGDITGHGLPAAVVGPEVTQIFTSMTRKGFSPVVILAEINQRLHKCLPVGIYMAAIMLELDESNRYIALWNGGMPDGLVLRGHQMVAQFPGQGFPLGIVDHFKQRWTRQVLLLEPGDRIVLYSDGIIEARKGEEEFGMERLASVLMAQDSKHASLESVLESLYLFLGDSSGITDDITLVEITI
ncbi:MAG: serine/threonine-protein phosphatase [Magnetococcus sp. YQC-5]